MGKKPMDCLLDRWQVWSELTDVMNVGEQYNGKDLESVSPMFPSLRNQFINAGYIRKVGSVGINVRYILTTPCPLPYDDRLAVLPRSIEQAIRKISLHKEKSLEELLHEDEPVKETSTTVPSHLTPKKEYDNAAEIATLKETVKTLQSELIALQATCNQLKADCEVAVALKGLVKALLK